MQAESVLLIVTLPVVLALKAGIYVEPKVKSPTTPLPRQSNTCARPTVSPVKFNSGALFTFVVRSVRATTKPSLFKTCTLQIPLPASVAPVQVNLVPLVFTFVTLKSLVTTGAPRSITTFTDFDQPLALP